MFVLKEAAAPTDEDEDLAATVMASTTSPLELCLHPLKSGNCEPAEGPVREPVHKFLVVEPDEPLEENEVNPEHKHGKNNRNGLPQNSRCLPPQGKALPMVLE